jgi:hypothetical protein
LVSTVLNNYNRKCKDSIGGISEIYLFPYVSYSRSQIVVVGNVLQSFPTTTIYKFYANGNPNANEAQQEDAGGKFYNQNIALELQGANESENISKLLRKDYRLIFRDRNGLYRIFGLYTGLEAEAINYTTGGGKSDFNGFNIAFTGREEYQSFFINDLENAGFFNADFNYRITQSGEFRITENNKFRILQ